MLKDLEFGVKLGIGFVLLIVLLLVTEAKSMREAVAQLGAQSGSEVLLQRNRNELTRVF